MVSPSPGRISSSTKIVGGRPVVDVSTYVPHLLATINNPLTRGASRYYLKAFGIGIVEWRVVSFLAIEPECSAARLCEGLEIDKASVSRALAVLLKRDFVEFEASETDERKKAWWLTTPGFALHDRMLAVALKRETALIRSIHPKDLEIFLRVARIMRKNIDHFDTDPVGIQVDDARVKS